MHSRGQGRARRRHSVCNMMDLSCVWQVSQSEGLDRYSTLYFRVPRCNPASRMLALGMEGKG